MPDEVLAARFKEELARWQALEPHQVEFFAPSFREAMLSLLDDTSEAAAIAIETKPDALLKLWCDRLEADIAILEAGSRSFVKSFLDKLPSGSASDSHPRGELENGSDEAVSFASYSSSESERPDSSASDDDDRFDALLCAFSSHFSFLIGSVDAGPSVRRVSEKLESHAGRLLCQS